MSAEQKHVQEAMAEKAAGWYVALREGELDSAGREEFVSWLRASPLHVAEYLAISGIGRDLPNSVRQAGFQRETLVAAARTEPRVVPFEATQDRPIVPGRRLRWIGLAAAVSIAAAGMAAWFTTHPEDPSFVTRHGEQRTWQLPDMSVLRLNSNSAVRVRFDDTHREVVLIRGQAYFDVGKDTARPFSVRTSAAVFTALGTAFDVYEQQSSTLITVVEGRVAVQRPAATTGAHESAADEAGRVASQVELSAGDQARVRNSGEISTVRANVPRATAWVRQEIAFERESIEKVVAEFNRYNRVQLDVDDLRVGRIPVSGVFHTYDVQSFVDFLDQLPNVRVTSSAGRAVVTYDP